MEPTEQRGATGAYAGYLALQRTREQDSGWQLLRADNAPLIASIMGRVLVGLWPRAADCGRPHRPLS